MFEVCYSFCSQLTSSSTILVSLQDLYTEEKGYGFVTEFNKNNIDSLQVPELNSGFDAWYWLKDELISHLATSSSGIFINQNLDFTLKDWPIPLCFKLKVPKGGNYIISVNLTNIGEDTEVFIFTSRRRLIAYIPHLKNSTSYTQTFSVNITDIIPRGKNTVHIDQTLDFTIISKGTIALSLLKITSVQIPTLYIAGDSTVTDQNTFYPYSPYASYCGWAQMLPYFMTHNIAISNHSHSGLTSETFRSEGHYNIILDHLKANDFVLFQFGHNDQKLYNLKAYDGYSKELLRYIKEIKDKNAYPILVTPLARNTWDSNGNYNDLLNDYSNACLYLGSKEDIPVIDLHEVSMTLIKKYGLEASKPFFFPNDYTHTNDYGGFQMAALVASLIKKLNIPNLSNYISKNIKEQSLLLIPPKLPVHIPVPPADYIDNTNISYKLSFINIDNPTSFISRVEILEWIIKAVGFVPTNVYNDHYIDVIGHEWYAGIVEVAYQNGIVDSTLTPNNTFFPNTHVTYEELISFLINSYKCRKTLPFILTTTSYEISSFATSAISIAETIGLLITPFLAKAYVTKEQAVLYIEKLVSLI